MIAVGLIFATVVYAATVSQQPYGIATPYWYGLTSRVVSTYYLAFPTLTSNDTAVGASATQDLDNKTIYAPRFVNASIHDFASTMTTWTLSTTEQKCFYLTGISASGTVNVIGPNTSGKIYAMYNWSGAPMVFRTSATSGVVIANAKRAMLIHNGTEYIRLTADASP